MLNRQVQVALECASVRALLVLLAWVAIAACGDFGGDYGYQGVQQVASGPYHVRSVFWLATEPIVLASRHDPNKSPQMHMISLVGGVSCKAGPLSSYVAAVDERGFRLALTDGDGNLRFYDEHCDNARPVVPDTDHLRVLIHRNQYQYLVLQGNGNLMVVDPFLGTQALVAKDVAEFEPSSLSVGPSYPFALWIRYNSGTVSLRTIEGKNVGESFKNISTFSMRSGLVLDGSTVELLKLEDDSGVRLYMFAQHADTPTATKLLVEPDACAAKILGIFPSDCADSDCALIEASEQVQQGVLPWLAMEAPCGSGDLLLSTVDGTRRHLVVGAASDYQLFPASPGGSPSLFFSAALSGEAIQTYFAQVQGSGQSMLVPQPTGEHFELGSLGRTPTGDYFTAVTAESHPRYGLWTSAKGFMPLLSDVADLYGKFLLHEFDGTTGRLAMCEGARCEDIAAFVPPGGFLRYTTLPRVGQGITVLAYLRDYDAETSTGTLTVYTPDLGLSRIVDRHVSGFIDVESGPVRGIVYSVEEKGGRQGIWFAPR